MTLMKSGRAWCVIRIWYAEQPSLELPLYNCAHDETTIFRSYLCVGKTWREIEPAAVLMCVFFIWVLKSILTITYFLWNHTVKKEGDPSCVKPFKIHSSYIWWHTCFVLLTVCYCFSGKKLVDWMKTTLLYEHTRYAR